MLQWCMHAQCHKSLSSPRYCAMHSEGKQTQPADSFPSWEEAISSTSHQFIVHSPSESSSELSGLSSWRWAWRWNLSLSLLSSNFAMDPSSASVTCITHTIMSKSQDIPAAYEWWSSWHGWQGVVTLIGLLFSKDILNLWEFHCCRWGLQSPTTSYVETGKSQKI